MAKSLAADRKRIARIVLPVEQTPFERFCVEFPLVDPQYRFDIYEFYEGNIPDDALRALATNPDDNPEWFFTDPSWRMSDSSDSEASGTLELLIKDASNRPPKLM